jgi:hypothetical protein
MVATFIAFYLILGLPAALCIWIVLIASKQHKDELQNLNRDQAEYLRFYERNTEPSSSQS